MTQFIIVLHNFIVGLHNFSSGYAILEPSYNSAADNFEYRVTLIPSRAGVVCHMLLPGLGSRSGLELGVFGSLEPEPEPLEKKPRAGADRKKKSGARAEAGASKKKAGSSALLEDKKLKEIVLLLLIFR